MADQTLQLNTQDPAISAIIAKYNPGSDEIKGMQNYNAYQTALRDYLTSKGLPPPPPGMVFDYTGKAISPDTGGIWGPLAMAAGVVLTGGALGAFSGAAAAGGAGGGAAAGATTGSVLGTAAKVGGIIKTASDIGKNLSPVLGNAAGAANRDQQINDQAQLQRAQLALTAPRQLLSNSVRASLVANGQPVTIGTQASPFAHSPSSTIPQFNGGLNPSAIDPQTRQLAQKIIADELQAQMSGSAVPQVGQGSGLGTALGGAALGSSLLGSLANLRRPGASGATQNASNVTGNYNPNDYTGINPDTGLYDPAYDPTALTLDPTPVDWTNLGTDVGGF